MLCKARKKRLRSLSPGPRDSKEEMKDKREDGLETKLLSFGKPRGFFREI